MKLLITGGFGHIGSLLLSSLASPDLHVTSICVVDNLATQRYPSLFFRNSAIPFEFKEQDICATDFLELCRGMDAVIHLAAITNAPESVKNPKQVEAVNFTATKKIAEACVENHCRLIFPSTTSVYGTQKELVDENCSTSDLKPQSPYAETKLQAEQSIRELGKNHGLNYVICRFGTIFGPSIGMRFHTAVNKFIWQAYWSQPITVWRSAMQQYRPYLALSDCIASIRYLLNHDEINQDTFNILTANYTVEEIIQSIQKIKPNLKIDFVDSPIMNQLSYHVSHDKFRNLGFEFMGNLDLEVKRTFDFLSGNYS